MNELGDEDHIIDDATIKQWSQPFREWHYFPHHVIKAKPGIQGFDNISMTDVPTIYQIPSDDDTDDRVEQWFMSFVGFDGSGYQSFVAKSKNLVDWTEPRLAFGYGKKGDFDYGGRVLGAYLYENYDIKAPRVLKKVKGKYWSLYGAYSKQGSYEIDPGYQGVASSTDGLLWERENDSPILSVDDNHAQAWEKASIYQPWVVESENVYYNFYNAKTLDPTWTEQVGIATSDDLIHWERYTENPILRVSKDGFDDTFCADGKIYWRNDHWVMLYFGVHKWTASIMVAYSRDLLHWTKDPQPLYKAGGHPAELDKEHAHKISLVWNPAGETYYMFYCAVGVKGRGIGLITSRPIFNDKEINGKGRGMIEKSGFSLKRFISNRIPRNFLNISLSKEKPKRPNVVLIMADDLGFSDVGCFGSEIETPNIDALGFSGIRFSQMYNCARCCPSRASLMTGLYPHQAGIGHMVHDSKVNSKAYQGYLRSDRPTIAEVLRDFGGYKTRMVGKWHVGGEYPPNDPEYWKTHAGDDVHPTPFQRGFQEHYGTLGGAGSYYDPPSLVHNDKIITETPDDYYYTDKINDEACRMIREVVGSNNIDADCEEEVQPFFLYIAHLAPHWPLHAPPEVISKYRGKYMDGWDKLRENRYAKLRQQGIIKDEWRCSPRDENSFAWEESSNADWEDAKMATYAAQIDIMDRGIGRVVQVLKECEVFEDTVIIFLSDNGGCAEFLKEDGGEGSWTEEYSTKSSDGTQTIVGNDPKRFPGDRSTFMSYGLPWANASNSPFRLFKSWVHEGGISTPFLLHWPNGIKSDLSGTVHNKPWLMNDIVATIFEVAGVTYPSKYKGVATPSLEGQSFLRALSDDNTKRGKAIFWEHQGNKAVRDGKWKLVYRHGGDWELFDMETDRTELHNLAPKKKRRVKQMIAIWEAWAKRCDVHPWPLHPIAEGGKDWVHFPWLW